MINDEELGKSYIKYCKIPIIFSPGHIFLQKAFWWAYFQGRLIFGVAYYWREICFSKWAGLDK